MAFTHSSALSPAENLRILLRKQARYPAFPDDTAVPLLAKAVCNLYDASANSLPTPSGQTGKFLYTDGTNITWGTSSNLAFTFGTVTASSLTSSGGLNVSLAGFGINFNGGSQITGSGGDLLLSGDTTIAGGVRVGLPTGGIPASGTINAKGFQIDGVPVGTSTDTYWEADAPGIKYVAGPVSLTGTPTGDAGDLQVEDLTSATATITGALSAASINGTVTLGTSGPQLSSFIAARGPSQGLVQDGTKGSGVSVVAFGEADATLAGWVNGTGTSKYIVCSEANGLTANTTSTGKLEIVKRGVVVAVTGNTAINDGKWHAFAYVRSGTSETLYIDGKSDATATSASTINYSVGITKLGAYTDDTSAWVGTIGRIYPYNRALTAAEVLSLYESGRPAGADFNSASNTAVYTSDFSAGVDGWGTDAGRAVTGNVDSINGSDNWLSTEVTAGPLSAYSYSAASFAAYVNKRVRVTVTIFNPTGSGITHFAIRQNDGTVAGGSAAVVALAENTEVTTTVTLLLSGASTRLGIIATDSGGTAVALATGKIFYHKTFTVYPLGLLLAPDATQIGNGLAWQDTSGNNADITLPATGVEWALPGSGTISLGTTKATQATIVASSAGALTITPAANTNLNVVTSGTGDVAFNTNVLYVDSSASKVGVGMINPSRTLDVTGTFGTTTDATVGGNLTVNGGTGLFQKTGADSLVHLKVLSDTYAPLIRFEGFNRSVWAGLSDTGADGLFVFSTAATLGTTQLLTLNPSTNAVIIAGNFTAQGTGAHTFAGSVTTGAPTTGTAAAWKLGSAVVSGTSTLLTDRYVEIDIGGTLYKVALVSNA